MEEQIMKFIKRHCLIFTTALLIMATLPNVAVAAEIVNDCGQSCGHDHYTDYIEDQENVWGKEVIIEVNSEEEFLLYPKNPNYRYTFTITRPSLTRAVCYMCGKSTMGTVTNIVQASGKAIACPTDGHNGNDIFSSWNHYMYERCTSCGYKGSTWLSQTTYTATCLNGDTPPNGGDWVVRYEYTQSTGYNLHQSLRWWTQFSYE